MIVLAPDQGCGKILVWTATATTNIGTGVQMKSTAHHLGITVSDLDRSIEFYSTIFGLEKIAEDEAGGDLVETVIGVPGGAMRLAVLAARNTLVELIQYTSSAGNAVVPQPNDLGAAHICFEVADIEAVHRDLVEKGVEFVSPPSEPFDGSVPRIAFLRDPDGLGVELLQPGAGGALEELLATDATDVGAR